jgi:Flp pilus assembly protein TadB
MVSFTALAAQSSAVASDFEVFRSGLRAGLDVEQCSAITSINASPSHSTTWMLFANRLEQGADLYTAAFDLRRAADSFVFDDFAELVIVARSHNWPGLERLLVLRSRFYRAWARDQLAAASRIRAATSVGWLAAAAPWVLVLLLLSRPENRVIFASIQGLTVLSSGALLTGLALFVSAHLSRATQVSRAENSNYTDDSLHLAARLELVGFLLDAGLSLRSAVEQALVSSNWPGPPELKYFNELISSGYSMQDAAGLARSDSRNDRLNELFTKLAIADQLGMVDSSEFFDLAQSLREQWLIQRAANALAIETKLLLPQVVLSLPLTVLFALFPSVSMLGSSLL